MAVIPAKDRSIPTASILGRVEDEFVEVLRLVYRQRRRLAVFLVPWVAIIGLSVPLLWWQIEGSFRDNQDIRGRNLLRGTEDVMERVLDRLGRDALFLEALTAQLDPRDLAADAVGGRLYLSFAASAPGYDQVRWIDAGGQERLRVDRVGDQVKLVPAQELQDKSQRPYFRNSVRLPLDSIYFSALDLNVEHGQVEVPFRPMLRVAVPVMINGKRDGIVIINYAAQLLLDRLQGLVSQDPGMSLYIANADGYWISGPSEADDWAWQRGRKDRGLERAYPGLWAELAASKGGTGHWRDPSGDWLFQHAKLGDGFIAGREVTTVSGPGVSFYLVAHFDSADADAREVLSKILLSIIAIAISLMIVVMAVKFARGQERDAIHTRELQAANVALTAANRHLQTVQQEIARAERLSSLGLMVAGVAHELNTPLGTANLALSQAEEEMSALEERLKHGLRRSDLESFITANRGGLDLARDAIERCARLVQRFKQVAVDRATQARRQMDLTETVMDSDPRLRKWDASASGIEIHCDLQPSLEMESYPGPLSQVVSNLLNNALKHAFPEGTHGTVTIRTRAEGYEQVRIEVEDDGIGVDERVRARMFEPFFTTARGRGGTGLGLHIVHQTVSHVLGGSIRVESPTRPGTDRGTRFVVILPRRAPDGQNVDDPEQDETTGSGKSDGAGT